MLIEQQCIWHSPWKNVSNSRGRKDDNYEADIADPKIDVYNNLNPDGAEILGHTVFSVLFVFIAKALRFVSELYTSW